ncbi:MAG: phosphoglucosamine mutase [Desulfobacteraceae bacterium]|nr:phosphoglucosamine mutase [Desulfobacteraceae bacterium]
MGKLFGTDGIRGVANEDPITVETAVAVGKAVAYLFKNTGKNNSIVIGKDPRISGDMLAHACASGICAMGVDACVLDTFPTAGVAFLVKSSGSMAGIMISASHNPYEDNGIKIFDSEGFKLSLEKENEIEALLFNEKLKNMASGIRNTGNVTRLNGYERRYVSFLKKALPRDFSLKDMALVLDCSNGATHKVAPKLFMELGAKVTSLFVHPDGTNINDHCGSQHPETLRKKVLETGAHMGLAFDGDGDRLIAVDEKGTILTGDQILFVCAKALKKQRLLNNNLVVSTVMSNLGLKEGLAEAGITIVAADVGDRHVMEKMKAMGAVLGGEDSGHTIFLKHHTTGDGILTALKLIESVLSGKEPLSVLAEEMKIFPQILINVNVKTKPDLKLVPEIQKAISSIEAQLRQKGRVLVRYSGTQAMCRVMVEGPTRDKTSAYASEIAEAVRKAIG